MRSGGAEDANRRRRPLSVADHLRLQALAGNRAVTQLLVQRAHYKTQVTDYDDDEHTIPLDDDFDGDVAPHLAKLTPYSDVAAAVDKGSATALAVGLW